MQRPGECCMRLLVGLSLWLPCLWLVRVLLFSVRVWERFVVPVCACAYRCFLASFSCYAATKYAGGVRCGASREVRITDNFPTIDIVVKTAHAKKVPEDRLSTTTSGSTTSMTWVTEVRRRCSPGHFAQHSLIVLVPTLSLSLTQPLFLWHFSPSACCCGSSPAEAFRRDPASGMHPKSAEP